jgi:hypothetical protein
MANKYLDYKTTRKGMKSIRFQTNACDLGAGTRVERLTLLRQVVATKCSL